MDALILLALLAISLILTVMYYTAVGHLERYKALSEKQARLLTEMERRLPELLAKARGEGYRDGYADGYEDATEEMTCG